MGAFPAVFTSGVDVSEHAVTARIAMAAMPIRTIGLPSHAPCRFSVTILSPPRWTSKPVPLPPRTDSGDLLPAAIVIK